MRVQVFLALLALLPFTTLSQSTTGDNNSDSHPAGDARRPVIIDTDIFADVDDVGALAIANVLHRCGVAEVKGIAINTHSRYGALAVSAINTYFGNAAIPIAALRPLTDEIWTDTTFFARSDYASKLAMNFPRPLRDPAATPTPTELYTAILEAAPEPHSVTIISLGFLTNLAALLAVRRGLLATKVRDLVIMGGRYPRGWEFNFGHQDPDATARVLRHWPARIPITYVGFELGVQILSGDRLRDHGEEGNPVRAAYEWYVGRCATRRESWDPIAVLYAMLGGPAGFARHLGVACPFEPANVHGYNSIITEEDGDGGGDGDEILRPGANVWVDDPSVTNQHWLRLAEGVSNESVAWLLDQFYVHDPDDRSCF